MRIDFKDRNGVVWSANLADIPDDIRHQLDDSGYYPLYTAKDTALTKAPGYDVNVFATNLGVLLNTHQRYDEV